jgi:hypothetical protein
MDLSIIWIKLTSARRNVADSSELKSSTITSAASFTSVRHLIGNSVKGLAARYATYKGRRKLGVISDKAYPAAGDVLFYQTRGVLILIRDFIGQRIESQPGSVVLLAHSLGGIASSWQSEF